MPSPFPGMDPYLERHWGDVHTSLVTYARNQLQKILPRDLRARVEERVVITGWSHPRSVYPDIRIVATRRKSGVLAKSAVALGIAEPIVIELGDEPETQRFVEIREVSDEEKLVTVLEVLSPSNKKPGDTQNLYVRKQQGLLESGVSLVEIDLLRRGNWIVAVPKEAVEPKYRTPYRVVVRRGWLSMHADYYPIALAQRLPKINVPLRPADAEVPLDLQALIEQCYEDGGYDNIDYSKNPKPPLSAAESRWAARRLGRGRRRPTNKRER